MFDSLRRIFGFGADDRDPPAPPREATWPGADPGDCWWKDEPPEGDETDEMFAVIGPGSDATSGELRALGERIESWHDAHPNARKVWGLNDLLAGRTPRTPPVFLMVPYPVAGFGQAFEPVALAFVARGTDHAAAMRDVQAALGPLGDRLCWLTDPGSFSHLNR